MHAHTHTHTDGCYRHGQVCMGKTTHILTCPQDKEVHVSSFLLHEYPITNALPSAHTHAHTHTCTRTHAHSPEAQKHTLPTFLFFNTPPVFQFLTLFSVSGLAVSTPPRSDPFTARPLVLTTTRPRSQRRLCVDTRPSVSCVILYI